MAINVKNDNNQLGRQPLTFQCIQLNPIIYNVFIYDSCSFQQKEKKEQEIFITKSEYEVISASNP